MAKIWRPRKVQTDITTQFTYFGHIEREGVERLSFAESDT